MEQLLICMSLSLIAGLLASRAAKAIRLPAVTSYLVAGLLLGPFFLGRLGLSGWGFGFGSLAQVESYGIITQVALGFIAFVIGNEFRLSALESMGRQAVTVGILQAVITTVLVDIALVALHFARPDVISMASASTLGAIASATAPAATLMGVNVNGTIALTFAIGSALAAVAGVLLCSAYPSLTPYTGSMPGIKAFVAAVFGGIGSIPGALIGGILLGIIEILSKAYISSQLSDAIVFSVLIIVLLVRPTGILGKKLNEKV